MKPAFLRLAVVCSFPLLAGSALAQGFGGGFGFGGGGRGGNQRVELLKDFDKDNNGLLDAAERKAARDFLRTQPVRGRGGRGGGSGPVAAGPNVKPSDAKVYGSEALYDPSVLRTFFLQFEENDWEQELQEFYRSDVKVPAKLTVDGKTYENVGVSFRGNSSFSSIPFGRKRSLDLEMDLVDDKQRLGGYRSLNLLNAHQDPTFMRSFLFV
jgi:hypothetical protein